MADDRACLAGNASGNRSGSASLRDGGALLLKAVPCNIIIIMLNLVVYHCVYNYQYCSSSLLWFHVIITYRIVVITLIIIIIPAWIFIIAIIAR